MFINVLFKSSVVTFSSQIVFTMHNNKRTERFRQPFALSCFNALSFARHPSVRAQHGAVLERAIHTVTRAVFIPLRFAARFANTRQSRRGKTKANHTGERLRARATKLSISL